MKSVRGKRVQVEQYSFWTSAQLVYLPYALKWGMHGPPGRSGKEICDRDSNSSPSSPQAILWSLSLPLCCNTAMRIHCSVRPASCGFTYRKWAQPQVFMRKLTISPRMLLTRSIASRLTWLKPLQPHAPSVTFSLHCAILPSFLSFLLHIDVTSNVRV